jgi:putative solute:sodium symporter small subunit
LLCSVLTVWLVFSYLAGIIFVNELNNIRLGGFKLGFWIAQQGAIYLYVILIFIYVILMNRLDKKHNLDEK